LLGRGVVEELLQFDRAGNHRLAARDPRHQLHRQSLAGDFQMILSRVPRCLTGTHFRRYVIAGAQYADKLQAFADSAEHQPQRRALFEFQLANYSVERQHDLLIAQQRTHYRLLFGWLRRAKVGVAEHLEKIVIKLDDRRNLRSSVGHGSRPQSIMRNCAQGIIG
jgi:hypothetical protein